ncbi:hypothetical protein ANN_07638 [Periplaneta americana]|uniref:Uncharacterized protein n=1 Tax=Periplaneta americana TaxID=6978 RepID=A0ABQ8SZ96_PERAM|nr:hypothetical protein ANN_07638 [Periplaneta americana]
MAGLCEGGMNLRVLESYLILLRPFPPIQSSSSSPVSFVPILISCIHEFRGLSLFFSPQVSIIPTPLWVIFPVA